VTPVRHSGTRRFMPRFPCQPRTVVTWRGPEKPVVMTEVRPPRRLCTPQPALAWLPMSRGSFRVVIRCARRLGVRRLTVVRVFLAGAGFRRTGGCRARGCQILAGVSGYDHDDDHNVRHRWAGHGLTTAAQTNFPLASSGWNAPQSSLSASTSQSPRPPSDSGSSSCRLGIRLLPSQTCRKHGSVVG